MVIMLCLLPGVLLGQTMDTPPSAAPVVVETLPPIVAGDASQLNPAPAMTMTSTANETVVQTTWHSIYSRPQFADRNSLSFIGSSGPGRFNVIDLEDRPNWDRLWQLNRGDGEDVCQLFVGLGFNVHWWAGPTSNGGGAAPKLPPQFFDLYLDCIWTQRWSDRLSTEVRVQPGLFTDFRTTPPDAFRTPGYAVGVFQMTPELSLVGGVDYLERLDIQLLPVAGVLWQPTAGCEFRLVFPQPKIAVELAPSQHLWGYVAGEYGGGRWTYKNDFGHSERVESSDFRATCGLEWRGDALTIGATPGNRAYTFLEAGYVFQRRLRFSEPASDVDPKPAWMVRFGCAW